MKAKVIVTSPKRRTYVHIRNGVFGILFLITMILRINKFENLSEALGFIILTVYIAIIALFIFLCILSRHKKEVGSIFFNKDELIIQLESNKFTFPIEDMAKFTIKRLYFANNNPMYGLISSYDNWVFIENMEVKVEYQFVIDSFYSNGQLIELIKYWKNLPTFTLIEGNK